jgi:hypothetical protein
MNIYLVTAMRQFCLLRFSEDGILAVRMLPEGLKVGSVFMATYSNHKYRAKIIYVGGKGYMKL